MFIHVIFVLTFLFYFFIFFMFACLFICFFLVENFNVYFLEFNNCVCKFDTNKNKNLLKKEKDLKWESCDINVVECGNASKPNKLNDIWTSVRVFE